MLGRWRHILSARFRKRRSYDIAPEDVLLDASNLPHLDPLQMEGRVERPVSRLAIISIGILFAFTALGFSARMADLQIMRGPAFAEASQENRLLHSLVFAERGVVYDRTGQEVAWNEQGPDVPYSLRRYSDIAGLAHLIGYVRYPKTDTAGIWWRTELAGVSGAEYVFDETLRGENGQKIVEVDALGAIQRERIVRPAIDGATVTLSVDATVQSALFKELSAHAERNGFQGGGAVIMDVRTGELLAITSFPEYDQQALADGDSDALARYQNDPRTPFLNRAVSGLYTPGSIVKPIFASAALAEGIIDAHKSIFSPGYISIPNPYNPTKPTIMKDWRAHGWTDMRTAIAVSSDVYFYSIGGGYDGQQGLGITKLDAYARRFGLGRTTGILLPNEESGVIPTPEWKKDMFGEDEEWRLGDTYNVSIGQYGFQITAIQAARYAAAIANGGKLLTPHIVYSAEPEESSVHMRDEHLAVVRDGMRLGVTSANGTARALSIAGLPIAAKTGTAEVGSRKEYMNSWVIGFWPADNPRYAFAAVLERAPASTLSGAAPGMRGFFEWMKTNKPEYVE
jgi:penicillin-binding protein 2